MELDTFRIIFLSKKNFISLNTWAANTRMIDLNNNIFIYFLWVCIFVFLKRLFLCRNNKICGSFFNLRRLILCGFFRVSSLWWMRFGCLPDYRHKQVELICQILRNCHFWLFSSFRMLIEFNYNQEFFLKSQIFCCWFFWVLFRQPAYFDS